MIKFFLLLLGILSSASAQMMLKKASDLSFKNIVFYIYFCFAGIFYVVSFGLYILILRYFPITKISPVMTLGTMIIVIIMGIFIFHETLTIKQMIGIVLGAIAIIFIAS